MNIKISLLYQYYQRNINLLISTSDDISYFGPKPSSFICISIFLYSTPQSLHFTSCTCISYCICLRICVCIPKLIILVIPAAVPPHLSCCECSVQGWLVKACMQALLASYHALVHFLATALLLFFCTFALLFTYFTLYITQTLCYHFQASLVTQNMSENISCQFWMKLKSEFAYDFCL